MALIAIAIKERNVKNLMFSGAYGIYILLVGITVVHSDFLDLCNQALLLSYWNLTLYCFVIRSQRVDQIDFTFYKRELLLVWDFSTV